MKTKHMKKYRISLLFLASIVFAFNHAHGFVYCQSEDGHRALETVTNTCCHGPTIHTSPEFDADSFNQTVITNNDGCRPCVDTLISIDVLNSDKRTAPLISAIAAVPAILKMTAGCHGVSEYVLRPEHPRSVNPSLPSIGTIILLV